VVPSSSRPFSKLLLKVRDKVLPDGLEEEELDWSGNCGEEVSPEAWHGELSDEGEERPILLDVRNWYESEVGRFKGARPLNTDTFRESWGPLEAVLEEVPKDARVLMYCTGGIRCVKAGAYVTQKLGFKNVGRLEKGIVAYNKYLKQRTEDVDSDGVNGEGLDSLDIPKISVFEGDNFVFDERVIEPFPGTCVRDNQL